MNSKALIWITAILVLAIVAVVYFQQRAKQKQIEAQNQQAANEAMLAMQYMNFVSNQDTIYAQEHASVGDWLSTISNIGSAVGAIFSGVQIGGAPSSGSVGGAQLGMTAGQMT